MVASRPVPVHIPSHHDPSHQYNSHKLARHHSHSVSAATSRHVHYADEISQPRSRKISAQSSHAVPIATTSRYLHPNDAQRSTPGHRRRVNSTGNTTVPAALNFTPSQSQQRVRTSSRTSGHQYSRCTGRKKALCVSKLHFRRKTCWDDRAIGLISRSASTT